MVSGADHGQDRRNRSARGPGRPKVLGPTERELQIARLAAGGLSRKEIGERLHLSQWTVKGHLAKLYAKLGLDNPRDRRELRRRLADFDGEGPR